VVDICAGSAGDNPFTMTWYAFIGALEQGLVYGIMVLGVYLTFRVLDFPDLTVDGSLPLGRPYPPWPLPMGSIHFSPS
jgi:ABC-type uncharacterized transport system permease subunit